MIDWSYVGEMLILVAVGIVLGLAIA